MLFYVHVLTLLRVAQLATIHTVDSNELAQSVGYNTYYALIVSCGQF